MSQYTFPRLLLRRYGKSPRLSTAFRYEEVAYSPEIGAYWMRERMKPSRDARQKGKPLVAPLPHIELYREHSRRSGYIHQMGYFLSFGWRCCLDTKLL